MPAATEDGRLFKIGEVCRLADVQPYVLRYWETEFPALTPNKSGGGQRLYTQREIDIVLRIKQLLYSEGFTIAGAKKKLDGELVSGAVVETNATAPAAAATRERAPRTDASARKALLEVRRELADILNLLDD